MKSSSLIKTKNTLWVVCGLLLLIAFALSIPQKSLYYFNQNTYFLHGLAQCDVGSLEADWLANTADPFPVFSWLVCGLLTLFGENAFYICFLVLAALFIFSLMGILSRTFQIENCTMLYLASFLVLLLLYSGILSLIQTHIPFIRRFPILFDPEGILTWGVADQYLLGNYLQPSVFGVFLLTSIYRFLDHKPYQAILFLALAPLFHSTYLLAAAVSTIAYLYVIYSETKSIRQVLRLGSFALVLVLPVIIYDFIHFHPTANEIYQKAQEILVNFRIPHHALPSSWLEPTVFIKMGIIIIALFIIKKTRLFPILLFSFIAAILLTFLQIFTHNLSLALLFPWRISVYLVPISSAILLTFILKEVIRLFGKSLSKLDIWMRSLILITVIVIGVLSIQKTGDLLDARTAKLPRHIRFIRGDFQNGDLYLVPPDLQAFRLETEVPIFVDLKTNPYKDAEVVEWYERNQVALDFYSSDPISACSRIPDLGETYGVTHIVLARTSSMYQIDSLEGCDQVANQYEDSYYTVYEIKP